MFSSKQESLQWGWLQHSWGPISCLGLFCQPFPHRQKVGWHTMGLHIPFGFHAHIWSHLAWGLGKLFPGKSPLVCMGSLWLSEEPLSPQTLGIELSTSSRTNRCIQPPQKECWQVRCLLRAPGHPPPSSSPYGFMLMAVPAAGKVPPVCCWLARWWKSGLPDRLLLSKLWLWVCRHRGLWEKSQPEWNLGCLLLQGER